MPAGAMAFGLEEPMLQGILWTVLSPVVVAVSWFTFLASRTTLTGLQFAVLWLPVQLLIGRFIVSGAACRKRLLSLPLHGKVYVVTGTGSGSGFYTALQLAKQGATVILGNRSVARSEESAAQMRREVGGGDVGARLKLVTKHVCELESLDSVRQFADEISQAYPKIDALVNNAGMADLARRMVGRHHANLEFCTLVNAIAPIVLTMRMLPLLKKSNARVVMVSSIAHGYAEQFRETVPKEFRGVLTDPTKVTQFLCGEHGGNKEEWLKMDKTTLSFSYGHAKFLVLAFADYLRQTHGLDAVSCQPGAIAGGFYRDLPFLLRKIFMEGIAYCVFNRTPKEGAQTNLWLTLAAKEELDRHAASQKGEAKSASLYANNIGVGRRSKLAQAVKPGVEAVEWIVRTFCRSD